jgi:hypothetical protein
MQNRKRTNLATIITNILLMWCRCDSLFQVASSGLSDLLDGNRCGIWNYTEGPVATTCWPPVVHQTMEKCVKQRAPPIWRYRFLQYAQCGSFHSSQIRVCCTLSSSLSPHCIRFLIKWMKQLGFDRMLFSEVIRWREYAMTINDNAKSSKQYLDDTPVK